ncbi:uncharacterized protein LOC135701907 [Ochlerotatus camptorhynchus]|uniref:uncharacterized protein LOC135701907 n=1 Tax=Ochlerotatus camptorhynchus TaxID=644619 RepID=UPI0031DED38B
MWIIAAVSVLLTFAGSPAEAKFVFELNDDFEQCEPDVPFPALNLSGLEFTILEYNTVISGKISFTEDYEAPVRVNFRSMRLERGTWRQGDIARTEMNVCPKLLSPLEPWFCVTRHFQQKRCPFKAGHEEILPMIEVGDFGIQLPPSFAGDWKFFMGLELKRNGRKVKECFAFTASVVEA